MSTKKIALKPTINQNEKFDNVVYYCVLKGKTTTDEQFQRFVDSICNSFAYMRDNPPDKNKESIVFDFFFNVDSDEAVRIINNSPIGKGEFYFVNHHIWMRNDDAGALRNQFLDYLVYYRYLEERYHNNEYIGFMDGDDEVNPQFFARIASRIRFMEDKPYIFLLNMISRYSDDGNQDYASPWISNVMQMEFTGSTLCDLACSDGIGGQAWGKLYEYSIIYDGIRFGRGLYEDVGFWYQVANKAGQAVQVIPDSIYIWRRDNQSSLTRVLPDVGAIYEAVRNLNYASEYAIRVFGKKKEDEEIWKRYSFAIMSMIRNVYRYSSDRTLEYLTAIKNNINTDFYQPDKIISSSPNFIEQASQYCEDFESICKMIRDVQ